MLGDAARRTPVVLLVLLSGLMVAGAEAFGVGIAARHYNLLVRQVRHYNLLARQVSWGVYRCDVWTTVVSGIVPWKA